MKNELVLFTDGEVNIEVQISSDNQLYRIRILGQEIQFFER